MGIWNMRRLPLICLLKRCNTGFAKKPRSESNSLLNGAFYEKTTPTPHFATLLPFPLLMGLVSLHHCVKKQRNEYRH